MRRKKQKARGRHAIEMKYGKFILNNNELKAKLKSFERTAKK